MTVDLSRAANAARDLARDMAAFDRDYQRWQREAKAALAAGSTTAELMAAVNQHLRGHPDLIARLNTLAEGLAAAAS